MLIQKYNHIEIVIYKLYRKRLQILISWQEYTFHLKAYCPWLLLWIFTRRNEGRQPFITHTHTHSTKYIVYYENRRGERKEMRERVKKAALRVWNEELPRVYTLLHGIATSLSRPQLIRTVTRVKKKRRRRVFFKSFLRLGWWVSFSTAVSPARQSFPRESKRWTMEMTIRLSYILLLVPGRLIAHPIPYFCWFTAPLVSYIYVIVQLFSDRMTTRGKASSWICHRLGHDRKYNKDKRNWPIDTRDHPEETPDIMWFRSTRIWMPRNGWKCCWPV